MDQRLLPAVRHPDLRGPDLPDGGQEFRPVAVVGDHQRQLAAALAGALGLLDKHADRAPVGEIYAAVPGARELAASPEGRVKGGGGLLGGLMKSAGGVSGAAMADAMGMLSRLQKQGVDKADLKALLPVAEDWIRAKTGRDLLREAVASVPGVGVMLAGR